MNPQDTAMYGNVAYMAKETKNYPAAIENYKKAIAMNSPESNAYYSEIFRINMEQKDTTAAIATLQQASAKYPDEAFFISNEADIYYRQGNVVKADALLDKLLAKDPKNPAYIRIKADTYFNQAFEAQETVRKLEDAKKYKEADAMLKKKSDMLGKALPLYLSLETMDPKNSEVVRMIKQVYFGLGNNEKTEEYSKKEKSLEGN
ncbi:MAG: tetratricopeptide repeat protein [Flavobacterium sp.]|nr:MAG: tetratricopeptide repeat protein [Flavobacterium sp.]